MCYDGVLCLFNCVVYLIVCVLRVYCRMFVLVCAFALKPYYYLMCVFCVSWYCFVLCVLPCCCDVFCLFCGCSC